MAESIKGLIEKIQQEGVKQAEQKAQEIERRAQEQAKNLIERALEEAREARDKAQQETEKYRQSSEEALQQSARDLLISLRAEINEMLAKIVRQEVSRALSAENLEHILTSLIKGCTKQPEGEIVISLNETDCEKLQGHFIAQLSGHLRDRITLTPSDDIAAGFTISFDAGRSQYDFSDKALADYLGICLKPHLARLLGSAPE